MYAYEAYQELIAAYPNACRVTLLAHARVVVALIKRGYVKC